MGIQKGQPNRFWRTIFLVWESIRGDWLFLLNILLTKHCILGTNIVSIFKGPLSRIFLLHSSIFYPYINLKNVFEKFKIKEKTLKKSSKVVYKGEPSGRGDPAVGIPRRCGPSGQETEGYL